MERNKGILEELATMSGNARFSQKLIEIRNGNQLFS